jgi:hypothetical protein
MKFDGEDDYIVFPKQRGMFKSFLRVFTLTFGIIGVVFFIGGFFLGKPLVSINGLVIAVVQAAIYSANGLGDE